jgi:hypothetical protein
MNMNAREKLVLVVVLVIVIWVAGIIAFIKPSIDAVKDAQSTLDQKKIELEEKKARIEEDKNLKEDIKVAYNKAVESGKLFYPRMIQHEAATEMQAHFYKNNDIEGGDKIIDNDNLSVSKMTAGTLDRYIFTPTTVNTTLDNIVAQVDGPSQTVATEPTSSSMTAYKFTTHFTAKKEDVLAFMDILADDEHTQEHRSMTIDSFTVDTVGKNDEGTEWSCNMAITMYMIPQLRDPDEVNAEIENGKVVNAVSDIAE